MNCTHYSSKQRVSFFNVDASTCLSSHSHSKLRLYLFPLLLLLLLILLQVRVMKNDLKVGDEIAVEPGDRKLEYRGAYFPVTDMVYLASGTGIGPILEQVKAVLPNGQSSVKSVTVIWMDEDATNFDVIADQLEREYHKYVNSLADNNGIVNAVPEFVPGTMAVLSGPRAMQRKAVHI
jgi:predicted ferric reductase